MGFVNFFTEWVLPLFIGSGAAIAVLIFLSKKLIAQQLSKGMEEFKAQLTEKTEALKHRLSIYAHERNIQAARIDSQKAKSIQEVYGAIVILLKHADTFANGAPSVLPATSVNEYEEEGYDLQKERDFRFYKEKAEYVRGSALKLSNVLLENAIFIDSSIHAKIETIHSSFLTLANEYLDPITEEECGRDEMEEIVDDLLATRTKLASYYNLELVDVKNEIISTFRVQLGAEKT